MNNKKTEILIIVLVILVQTIFYIIAGANKSYIHMDEAYSLGLASYKQTEIQNNSDFYNVWHDNAYYEDYLCVNTNEKGNFSQVYENQKNDVHPPLYYLLLRISMAFSLDIYSKWPGIVVNIIIYVFITVFMYLLLQELLSSQKNCKEKSIILAFVSSITLASLSSVIYIRMYALSTLNIVVTTFLHIKLLKLEKNSLKLLFLIGLSALIGSLTHYYYLFYLCGLFILVLIKYIKEKKYKDLFLYILTIFLAAITSIAIFPYSIKHLFFGYRGKGALSKLLDFKNFFACIGQYIYIINKFAFNNLLFILLLAILAIFVLYKIRKNKVISCNKNKYCKFIIFPTILYFFFVSLSSPWIELRYVMPICSLIFVLIIYYLYNLLISIFSEKVANIIAIALLLLLLLTPFIFKIEPQEMYLDKKEIVESVETNLNLPTIYFFNSSNNRFLDDILLFSKLSESYIAKDIDCNENSLKDIFKNKNTSNGILVFINEGQKNDDIISVTKETFNFNDCTYIKRLNACDVYYCFF